MLKTWEKEVACGRVYLTHTFRCTTVHQSKVSKEEPGQINCVFLGSGSTFRLVENMHL